MRNSLSHLLKLNSFSRMLKRSKYVETFAEKMAGRYVAGPLGVPDLKGCAFACNDQSQYRGHGNYKAKN